MSPYMLNPETQSTRTVYEESFYTLTMARIVPEAGKHAAAFEALCTEGLKVLDDERKLEEAGLLAQAQVQAADLLLNRFVDRLLGVLAGLGEGRPGTPGYELFFRERPPSALKKFVLGEQLETMRGFVAKLEGSGAAALKALAPDLKKLIEGGDQAKAAVTEARSKLQLFRQTGARQAFFDKANSTRRAAYGELSKLPFDKPELHLEADFGDRFFRVGPRPAPLDGDPIEAARAEIAATERELAEQKQALVALEALALAEAKEAEERAAKEKRVAELSAQAESVAREKAVLTKELGSKRRPARRRR